MKINNQEKRVFLVCTDEELAKDVGDCLKRVSAALSSVNAFVDASCDLDENSPDFEQKIGPVLHRLILTLIELYPNPKQFDADIKAIGDFTVRKVDL